jgi:hypothetical protein
MNPMMQQLAPLQFSVLSSKPSKCALFLQSPALFMTMILYLTGSLRRFSSVESVENGFM